MGRSAVTGVLVASLSLGVADVVVLNLAIVPAAFERPGPVVAEEIVIEPEPEPVAASVPAPVPAPVPDPPSPPAPVRPPEPVRPPASAPVPSQPIVIHFATDRATLSPTARERLDSLGLRLLADPAIHIYVGGHADERGAAKHNHALGMRRARRVAAYLVTQGVTADRIAIRSFGETAPVSRGLDEASLTRNRRVEIELEREP
jgi:outer membrane protein OmpA-like peptidoglycan-associated protein